MDISNDMDDANKSKTDPNLTSTLKDKLHYNNNDDNKVFSSIFTL